MNFDKFPLPEYSREAVPSAIFYQQKPLYKSRHLECSVLHSYGIAVATARLSGEDSIQGFFTLNPGHMGGRAWASSWDPLRSSSGANPSHSPTH